MDSPNAAGLIMCLVIGIVFYVLPSIIAMSRKHHNTVPIILINLLTGWTFIGWFIALIWSCCAVNTSTSTKSM